MFGRVTDEQFRMLSSDYNTEQKTLEDAVPEKEAHLESLKASAANVDAFIEKAKRYTDIENLTPELLRLFVQRIEMGERSEKYSRHASQEIKIIYRDIGIIDSPMEDEAAPVKLAPSLEETVITLGYQADGNRQEDTTSVSDSFTAANTPATATKDTISIPA